MRILILANNYGFEILFMVLWFYGILDIHLGHKIQ